MSIRTRQPEQEFYWAINSRERKEDDDIPYEKMCPNDFYVDYPNLNKKPKTVQVDSISLPNYFYNVYSRRNDILTIGKVNDSYDYADVTTNLDVGRYYNYSSFFEAIEPTFEGSFYNDKFADTNMSITTNSNYTLNYETTMGRRELELDYLEHRSFAFPVGYFSADSTFLTELNFINSSEPGMFPTTGSSILASIGEPATNGVWYLSHSDFLSEDSITIDSTNNDLKLYFISSVFDVLIVPYEITIPSGTYNRIESSASTLMSNPDLFSISGNDFYFPLLSEAVFYAFRRNNFNYDCYLLCRGRLPTDDSTTPLDSLPADSKRGRFFMSFEKPIYTGWKITQSNTAPLTQLGFDKNFTSRRTRVSNKLYSEHSIIIGPFNFSNNRMTRCIFSLDYYENSSTSIYDYSEALKLLYSGNSMYGTGDTSSYIDLRGMTIRNISELQTQITAQLPVSGAILYSADIYNTDYIKISASPGTGTEYPIPIILNFFPYNVDYDDYLTMTIETYDASFNADSFGCKGQIYIGSSEENMSKDSPLRVSKVDLQIYKDIKNYLTFHMDGDTGYPDRIITLSDGFYTSSDFVSEWSDQMDLMMAGASPPPARVDLTFNEITGKFSLTSTEDFTIVYNDGTTNQEGKFHKTLGFTEYYNQEIPAITGGYPPTNSYIGNEVPNLNLSKVYLVSNIVVGYRSIFENSAGNLGNIIAIIYINQSRGGITSINSTDEKFFPIVKTNYNDTSQVFNDDVNFKLLNEEGYPLSFDGAFWSMSIKILF